MWAEILSSMIGPAMEGIASAAQYQASKHERNISWKRMGQWALQSPSLMVAGLRQAGLNPILAATGGFKGASAPDVPMASPGQKPNFRFDLSSALDAKFRKEAMPDQLETVSQGAKEAKERAIKAYHDREFAYHAAGSESERWSNLQYEGDLIREQIKATAAQARERNVNAELMETTLPSARALEELYEKYPLLRQAGAVGDVVQKLVPKVPIKVETGGKTINVPKKGR